MAEKNKTSGQFRPERINEGSTKGNSKPVSGGPKTTAPPPKAPPSKKG